MPTSNDDQTLISLLDPRQWLGKTDKTNKTDKINDQVVTNFSFKKFIKDHKLIFLFLSILVLVAYLNSLGNGLVSDDQGLILEGDNILKAGYIFADPLSFLHSIMVALTYIVVGINPLILHLENLIFHLGNVWLVFIIISLMISPVAAFFTASMFAVHPLLSEAVTWFSGGPYSQYSFFFLFSFLFYLLSSKAEGKEDRKWYKFSLVFFVIGLFDSNRIMTLSPVFLVYELLFGDIKKNWNKVAPYLILSFFWGLFYLFQITRRQQILQSQYYLPSGTDNPLIQLPFAISNYLYFFLWPKDLTFFHSNLKLSYFDLGKYWVGFLTFLGFGFWAFLKNKMVFFWLCFFIISLWINLLPLRLGWVVAERYVYLGTLGLIVIVAMIIAHFYHNKKISKIVLGVFLVLLFAYTVRTIVRNFDWKSEKTLWTSTVTVSPESPKAHNFMGAIDVQDKKYADAEKEFKTAINLKPDYADAYHNLANLYQTANRYDLAIPLYQQALKINPSLWKSLENLGGIYLEQGDKQKALDYMTQALKVNSVEPELWTSLGIVYYKMGDKVKATEAIQKALSINPKDQRSLQVLGLIK